MGKKLTLPENCDQISKWLRNIGRENCCSTRNTKFSVSLMAQQLLDPIPRPCRTLAGDNSQPRSLDVRRNEYPAGGTLMVLAQVPGGVKGIFEFYLCLEDGNNEHEECLVRQPLQLADGSGTRFDMSKVPATGNFEIPIIIPDSVSCERCTLQWRVLVADCPKNETCQVMDQEFCSDISVREIKTTDKRIFGFIFRIFKNVFGNPSHYEE